MQRSLRFPPELDARLVALAGADDRSFSYVVFRALESALGAGSTYRDPVGGGNPQRASSTPSRASAPAEPSKAQADWEGREFKPVTSESLGIEVRKCESGCRVPAGTELKRCVRHGLLLR